jgi:hypothetical protein
VPLLLLLLLLWDLMPQAAELTHVAEPSAVRPDLVSLRCLLLLLLLVVLVAASVV